jgi:hypothetical protein
MKVVLPPLVMAGGALTDTLSVFDWAADPWLVCTESPPPHASAVLLTDVGEFAGTLTVRLMVELDPLEMPGIAVQATRLFEPLQVHKLEVEV